MTTIWMAVLTAVLCATWVGTQSAHAQFKPTYRCVIASGGQMVYSRGGFRSFGQCVAFCEFNAEIRRLGGAPQTTWRCIYGF